MKILIVEDEKLLADSLRAMLEGKGFAVEAVYDGETGAEYAETGVYDLLILDVMMPGLDGYQVALRDTDLDADGPVFARRPDRGAQRGRGLLPDEAL